MKNDRRETSFFGWFVVVNSLLSFWVFVDVDGDNGWEKDETFVVNMPRKRRDTRNVIGYDCFIVFGMYAMLCYCRE